jgi:hypothetical protein
MFYSGSQAESEVTAKAISELAENLSRRATGEAQRQFLVSLRLRRLGQVALVGPDSQPQDLGYSRVRLIVRPVGIDEDKGLTSDVLDLN